MEASVFDDIFFPRTAEKYRAAPLVGQRERYLVHLKATGARRSTLRKCANDQLSLVRLLDLKDGDRVSRSQIQVAAALWSQPRGRRCDRAASRKTRDRFVSHGVRWLGFLGWLDDGGGGRHPHDAEVQAFARWLREERGLSDATVQSYRAAADHFFGHLAAKGVRLSAVGMHISAQTACDFGLIRPRVSEQSATDFGDFAIRFAPIRHSCGLRAAVSD